MLVFGFVHNYFRCRIKLNVLLKFAFLISLNLHTLRATKLVCGGGLVGRPPSLLLRAQRARAKEITTSARNLSIDYLRWKICFCLSPRLDISHF